MNAPIWTGKTEEHIEFRTQLDHRGQTSKVGLQLETWLAFDRLKARAKTAGIELCIASGFRGFERQQLIWNAKARGERPLLSSDGQPLDASSLDAPALCHAILRWSALPGGSRHHWGTDMDVYDLASLTADYSLQLVPEEYTAGGPFAEFNAWFSGLDARQSEGFIRPYLVDHGGIAVEPWHLSYAPLANELEQSMSLEQLSSELRGCGIELEETVLQLLPELYERYCRRPGSAPSDVTN